MLPVAGTCDPPSTVVVYCYDNYQEPFNFPSKQIISTNKLWLYNKSQQLYEINNYYNVLHASDRNLQKKKLWAVVAKYEKLAC